MTRGEAGRPEAGIAPAREGVDLYRELARRDPNAFQAGLAWGLDGLGSLLGDAGAFEEACQVATGAVDVHRKMLEVNPEAFRPGLSQSLADLSVYLTESGRHAEALAALTEAVLLLKPLAPGTGDLAERTLGRLFVNYHEIADRAGAEPDPQVVEVFSEAAQLLEEDAGGSTDGAGRI